MANDDTDEESYSGRQDKAIIIVMKIVVAVITIVAAPPQPSPGKTNSIIQ